MFLANWFELSGVDEILAPTREDSPAPKGRIDEESPIWSILAPRAYPDSGSTMGQTPSADKTVVNGSATNASDASTNNITQYGECDHVTCIHCNKPTPIKGQRFIAPPTFLEPPPSQVYDEHQSKDQDLHARVIVASTGAAATSRETNNTYEQISKMFDLITTNVSTAKFYDPNNPSKNIKKFKRHIDKYSHLNIVMARAGGIRNIPDGFTALHAACHGKGNPEVVSFLLQEYILREPTGDDKEEEMLDINDRDVIGCTALHVAATFGNVVIEELLKDAYQILENREKGGDVDEMTEQLKGMSTDQTGPFTPPPKSKGAVKSRSPKPTKQITPTRFSGEDAPTDLSGRTPLGLAMTSREPGASRNRESSKKLLYGKGGDRCVDGEKTPPNTRCGSTTPVRHGRSPLPPVNYLSPTPKKGLRLPMTSSTEYGTPFQSPPPTISEVGPVDNKIEVLWGVADKPGWRVEMEDAICAHCLRARIPDYESNADRSAVVLGLFGVFDGHGDGGIASKYISQHLLDKLEQHPQWPVAYHTIDSDNNSSTEGDGAMMNVLEETFHGLDDDLKNGASQGQNGGTTAVVSLVSEGKLIVANLGDSRCILVKKKSVGEKEDVALLELNKDTLEVIPLSEDHKPNLPTERARIEAAGMSIHVDHIPPEEGQTGPTSIHKVKRSDTDLLAVARAFGDFDYKSNENLSPSRQAVVCTPEIVVRERNLDEDMYLILACDGVWDVMSNEEVGVYIAKRAAARFALGEEDVLAKVGDDLLDLCLNKGSTDNMSVLILSFPASGIGSGLDSSAAKSEVVGESKKLFSS
ncbi:hypothetical protein ACHAXN_001891 [Cyclotella atomus]